MYFESGLEFIKCGLNKRRSFREQKHLVAVDGFTVIELICSLVLIGILSSMAVPKYIALQDHSRELTINKAVNQLNVEVREIFKKNKLDEKSTSPYQGYTGDLGPEVIITGQAPDTPASGTIRLVSNSDVYEINWTPGAQEDSKSAGHFKLGK